MTVETTTSSITYTGNGVATNFSIPYEFKTDDQIVVTKILISTLVGTVLLPSEFILTGAGLAAPGNCNIVPALSALYRVNIARVTSKVQEVDIDNNDGFLPDVIENQLDLIVMQIQELAQAIADAVSGGIVASISNAVAGPGVSVNGNFAMFNGLTGKIIIDNGYKPADFALAAHTHAFAALTAVPSTIAGYGITDIAATVAAMFTGGTHTGLSVVYDAGVPAVNFTVASTDQWTDIIKNATTTIATNTVLAVDAQLQFPMLAGESYIIEADVWITSVAASGYKTSITGPAAPTSVKASMTEIDDGNNITNFDVAAYATLRNNTPAGTEITHLMYSIIVENGANAGTFGINFAQNVSNAAVLTVHKGSRLRYRRIA